MLKKIFNFFFINLLVLFIGLIIIELLFGSWIFTRNNLRNLNLIIDKQIIYKTDFYTDSLIDVKYSRDKYGLRGETTFNKPYKIDLLTVGGSTTDQRYIRNGETWQDILEDLIQRNKDTSFYIANAGIDGHSTFGHIKSFDFWLSKIPNLKPKYILFYVGINDLFNISQESRYDKILNESFRNYSIFFYIYRQIRGYIIYEKITINNQSKFKKSDIKFCKNKIANKEFYNNFNENLILFEKRLNVLTHKCEKFNSIPIFVTQPSYISKIDLNNNIIGVCDSFKVNNTTINGVDYGELINKINNSIYSVCKDKYQVIDLTNNSTWEKEDFYDFIHKTPDGNYKLAKLLYQNIKIN